MKGITCTHTETIVLAGAENRLIDTLTGKSDEIVDVDASAELCQQNRLSHLFVKMGREPIVSDSVHNAIFETIERHATVKLYIIQPTSIEGYSIMTVWHLTRSLERDVGISYVRMFEDTLVVQFGYITR